MKKNDYKKLLPVTSKKQARKSKNAGIRCV